MIYVYIFTFCFCPLVTIGPNGTFQLAAGPDGVQGLQTLAMANASSNQQTILQYAQTSDGQQILVPSNQVVVQSKFLEVEFDIKLNDDFITFVSF